MGLLLLLLILRYFRKIFQEDAFKSYNQIIHSLELFQINIFAYSTLMTIHFHICDKSVSLVQPVFLNRGPVYYLRRHSKFIILSCICGVGDVFHWPPGPAHSLETDSVPAAAASHSQQRQPIYSCSSSWAENGQLWVFNGGSILGNYRYMQQPVQQSDHSQVLAHRTVESDVKSFVQKAIALRHWLY